MGTKQISRFRIALIGGLIVFVLAVLCGAYLLRPSLRARYLVHELEPLQVSHSSFEDAQRLAEKLGAKPEGSCDRSYCFWDVVVNNARLP